MIVVRTTRSTCTGAVSPGADVAGVSPVPVQMWPGADVAGVSPVPVQMWPGADVGGVSPVPVWMWEGRFSAV
jgi:hypothetical protein